MAIAWYTPSMPKQDTSGERFTYVGCVHEAAPSLLQRLEEEAKNPPNHLIFAGDVTGSPRLEGFKRLFYNHVYNRARKELSLGTNQAQKLSDDELLAFIGLDPPREGHTLYDGIIDLLSFQYQLEGDSVEQASERADQHTATELANLIRHISTFEYFGPWVGILPLSVRQGVISTIESNTRLLIDAIQPFLATGSAVHICGGNWDRASVTKETFGADIDVYDPIPAFRQAGINFHEKFGWLETNRSIQVLLPYWSLLEWTPADQADMDTIEESIRGNRSGKTVLVIAHAEPNWRVHNTTNDSQPGGDRQVIIERLDGCLARLDPDEVVYPHQHNLLTNEDGTPLDPNTKYVLSVTEDSVTLVDSSQEFGHGHQIIATYIPLQRLGHLTIPHQGNPRPNLFGGDRDTIFVS